MNDTSIDPNDMCGYESIWLSLMCKNSPLIYKYNLNKMTDLYILLRYGKNQYPQLFDEENVKKFYNKSSSKIKNMFDEFKNELFNTNNRAIWKCYYPLVAIYFNIEIILIDKNNKILEGETNMIKYTLDNLDLIPQHKIRLQLTQNHVEYIPENDEIEVFENFKKEINNDKLIYNERLMFDNMIDNDDLFNLNDIMSDIEKL